MDSFSNKPESTQQTANEDNIIYLKNFIGYAVDHESEQDEFTTFFPEYSEEYLSPVCNWE